MDDPHGPHADHVRKAGSGVRTLACTGLAAQLGGDLADLPDTGRPDGMPHREQPAGGAYGDPAADVELARFEVGRGAAGRTYAHGFDVEELLDRERVVQFDDVEVSGGDAGLAEGLRGGLAGERGVAPYWEGRDRRV